MVEVPSMTEIAANHFFKKNYKVIGRSNFNLESVADILIQDNLTEANAVAIVESMNKTVQDGSTYYYYAVPQDTRLSRGMEDLV